MISTRATLKKFRFYISKWKFYLLRMGIQHFKMDYYILKWEFCFLRMEILLFKIENSTDIFESKTNLPLYSQIN